MGLFYILFCILVDFRPFGANNPPDSASEERFQPFGTATPLRQSKTHSDTGPKRKKKIFARPAPFGIPVGPLDDRRRAAGVLASFYGERKHFTVDNDLLIGVTRSFRSFSESLDEVKNARIFAGIHFRSACDDGQTI